jgi:short-subunit dehydrogenase
VLFVGSVAGLIGVREEAVYAASKAAVQAFADSLREELAGSGVAIVTVAPGAVRTPFFERRGTPYDRRWPRPVAAERVAGVVVAALAAGRSGDYVVPGWLALPVRLRGALPGAYRRLARRFG